MKKHILPILIGILIISQIMLLSKIDEQQSQIENMNYNLNQFKNDIRNKVGVINENVYEMLEQEASLIASASTEIGVMSKEALTVPITFTLTPKEVSNSTTVSLNFDGAVFPMQKNGTSFSVTVSCDVFASVTPMIVIEENGVKKTEQNDRIAIRYMKESIFPSLHVRLLGEASFGGKNYRRKGTLRADIKKAEIEFTELHFVIKVDHKVISDTILSKEKDSFAFDLDEAIPMEEGQTCTMTVIATDSIGLEHHYLVDHWVAGSHAQRETWFGDEQIYSADGKLLSNQ